MPAVDLEKRYRRFNRDLEFYRDLMVRMTGPESPLTKAEKELLAELIIGRMVALWERLLDELIVASVHADPGRKQRFPNAPDPRHPNMEECKGRVFGKKRYLAFGQTKALIEYSVGLLSERGNPFFGDQEIRILNR